MLINASVEFSKNNTIEIKGFAIIFMILHHLFIDPSRMNSSMQIISSIKIRGVDGEYLSHYIARFGIICISLFLFLCGFGLMKKYSDTNGSEVVNGIFNRLRNLYCDYWKVFIIVVPISYLIFADQPIEENPYYYSRFLEFTLNNTIGAFLGLYPEKICGEWWFFKIYLTAVLLFPLIRLSVKQHSFWRCLWKIIIVSVFLINVYSFTPSIKLFENLSNSYIFNHIFEGRENYFAAFLIGVLMGENNNLLKVEKGLINIGLCKLWHQIMIAVVCVFVRNMIGVESDIFILPYLIISLKNIAISNKALNKVVSSFGRHSTTMWLLHAFIIYYWSTFQKIILMPRYAGLVALWALIFVWLCSIGIDYLYVLLKKIRVRVVKESKKYDGKEVI